MHRESLPHLIALPIARAVARGMLLPLFALAAALTLTGHAHAASYTVGDIEITTPWARATPKGAAVGGAYMTITNKGTTADRLIGGSSPAAARFEVHQMTMDAGVMKMRPVTGGLEIKPGATVELKPETTHVMLIGLKQPLQQGKPIKATLQFEKAGKVEVEYPIEPIGAPHSGSMGSMDQMKHGH